MKHIEEIKLHLRRGTVTHCDLDALADYVEKLEVERKANTFENEAELNALKARVAALEAAQAWHDASEPPEKLRPVLLLYQNEWKMKRVVIAQYARGKDLLLDFDCDPWEGCFFDEEEQQHYCSEGWYYVTECEDVEYNVVGTKLCWRDLPPIPEEGEK